MHESDIGPPLQERKGGNIRQGSELSPIVALTRKKKF